MGVDTKTSKPRRCRAWGYGFDWSELHLTSEQMRPMIFRYDELGSACLERLDKFSPRASSLMLGRKLSSDDKPSAAQGDTPQHRDLYALLKTHAGEDDMLQKLWLQINTVPVWVDWDQIERGQKVFYRYAGPTVVALTFQSLLGGMGGRRVVETLGRTGGFGVNVVRRRLLETFQYLLEVTRDVDSVKPGGNGFVSSIRVRFLHAQVRRRILELVKQYPDYYDVEEFGIPVNDLDSIGTICTFSASIIWISFPRQGIFPRKQEIADYIALWRWLAYLLGTPTEFFSTPAPAKAIMESLLVSEMDPTGTSISLANNILAGLQGQPPSYASAEFLRAETHWLNGRQLSMALAVPRPPLFHTSLVVGQCLFFMFWCYLHRSVPSWDEARIKAARRILLRLTSTQLDNSEVYHEFKYIPNFGQTTEAGQSALSSFSHRGVEWRNLKALLIAVGFVCVAVWLAWVGLSGLALHA